VILFDVNVLVYAHREDAQGHRDFRLIVEHAVNSEYPFGFSDLVASCFLRVVTHPRIFDPPSPLQTALSYVHEIRERPNAVLIEPGNRHWAIFSSLCRKAEVKGNLVPDAFLAALAIESGCTWVTTDRDYSRFPDLHWKHPSML
jgi:toxin-antitoxin system PIN domain toxin